MKAVPVTVPLSPLLFVFIDKIRKIKGSYKIQIILFEPTGNMFEMSWL
jgi:hypothetical protein